MTRPQCVNTVKPEWLYNFNIYNLFVFWKSRFHISGQIWASLIGVCRGFLNTYRSILEYLTFMGPCNANIFQYISNKMQLYTVYLIWKLFYMFRLIPSPIIKSANNCIYSIWYLSHRYCYLPLSWKCLNWFQCAVGGVDHSQYTQTSSISSTIAADSSNGVTNTRCCRHMCLRFWWWVMVPSETC